VKIVVYLHLKQNINLWYLYMRKQKQKLKKRKTQRGGNLDTYNIEIIENEDDKNYRITTSSGEVCADFIISAHGNYIEVDSLKKCNKTGKTVLQDIESFAKERGISEIKLADDSHIILCGHKISLALLNILSKNRSWYNSMGFFSDHSSLEETENKKILQMPMNDFLSRIQDFISPEISKLKSQNLKYGDPVEKLKMFEMVDNAIKTKMFSSIISTDATVMQYFSHLQNKMRSEKDFCKKEYETLAVFLKVVSLSKIIKYYPLLTKSLDMSGGRRIKIKTRKRSYR